MKDELDAELHSTVRYSNQLSYAPNLVRKTKLYRRDYTLIPTDSKGRKPAIRPT